MKPIVRIGAFLLLLLLAGCGDNSDNFDSEAQLLLEQFGDLQPWFTEEGMQGLLDYEDTGRPVTLVQLMSITDREAYARYQEEAAALWESIGATERFHSEMFDQLIGERFLNQTHAIEFPSVMVLLSAMQTPAFTDLMNTLAEASNDHAWVFGEEQALPFEPGGSYFDPALQNLNSDQARALLDSANGGGEEESGFDTSREVIVDMMVSDVPSPFWMVNLIHFYETAQFQDGRETDLSGQEANEIYGNAIFPTLLRYNSLPELLMPVAVTLTDESVEWDQAAIVRYASRDGFLNAFPLNPGAGAALAFKKAGVENTLVYPSEVPGTVLPAPATGPLFDFRYCEVLLFYPGVAGLRADVYNSMLQSTCPQDIWDALDAEEIADDYGAQVAGLNGIRFWVLDFIENNQPPQVPVIENFGGIRMRLAASVEVPGAEDGETARYVVNRVSRDTVFHYVAGRQVYELEDPQGIRYRMQSFTQGNDPDQQLVDLQRLERRLDLPAGWSFHVSLMAEDFELLTIDGIAEVIVDDLGNTYQRVP